METGPGTYTLTYAYTDNNGCVNQHTNTITVFAMPVITWYTVIPIQCINSTVYPLTGAQPLGGTYNGLGVSDGNFNASVAGIGTHTLTYSYTDVNGCSNWCSNVITVNSLPEVTFGGSLSTLCTSSTVYPLEGGQPAGGTYSGPGVEGDNFNASIAGPGIHTIIYSYTDVNGCTGTATNTITVTTGPTLEISQQAVSQTVNASENASFNVSVTNATTFIWQVSTDDGNNWNGLMDGTNYTGTTTANLQIINTPLSFNGYLYRCVAGAQPCDVTLTSDAAMLTVTEPGSTINGTVKYDNTAGTPMWNTTVELKQGTNVVMSAITDISGFYEFTNVPAGAFILNVTPAHPWGGVNNTDALIILRKYMGLVTLTGLKLKVGDVNGNGYINTTDALITQLRFMGTSNLMYADWYFESPQVTVSSPSTQTFNIRGLCIGDVNASYEPAVQGFTNCGDQLTDIRDGKKYNTIQIGNQCWMRQNLNVGTLINGNSNASNNGVIEKYCYNNLQTNCNIYGALYQWDEMMQYSTTPGIKGICPTGWHVPADGEWTTLTDYLGGLDVAGGKMKEAGIAHWNSPNSGASNESGFTALAGGRRNGESATFNDLGGSASFWSSSAFSSTSAWYRMLHSSDAIVNQYNSNELQDGFSVRCVKD
ncbi:MAG: hypothetical protein NTU44_03690 [Bacteroidetes bacterium]|nr:hypothetical protein [Bacteroidota bacterium]